MADPASSLVKDFADGVFQTVSATDIPHHSQTRSIRRPVSPLHVLQYLARRSAGKRGTGQSSHVDPGAGAMAVERNRHFAGWRYRQQLGVLESKRPRFGRARTRAEDLDRVALP